MHKSLGSIEGAIGGRRIDRRRTAIKNNYSRSIPVEHKPAKRTSSFPQRIVDNAGEGRTRPVLLLWCFWLAVNLPRGFPPVDLRTWRRGRTRRARCSGHMIAKIVLAFCSRCHLREAWGRKTKVPKTHAKNMDAHKCIMEVSQKVVLLLKLQQVLSLFFQLLHQEIILSALSWSTLACCCEEGDMIT